MIPSAVESDHHVAATDGSMVVGSTGAERRKECSLRVVRLHNYGVLSTQY